MSHPFADRGPFDLLPDKGAKGVWEHVAGEAREPGSLCRTSVPGGWLYVVDGSPCFVPSPPPRGPTRERAPAVVIEPLSDVIDAPPGPTAGPATSPALDVFAYVRGEGHAPEEAQQISGAPTYMADDQLRGAFSEVLLKRLARRPVAPDGWYAIRKIVGRQPPHRGPLWESFGYSDAHEDAMIEAAAVVFEAMGYAVEDAHVYAPRSAGAPGRRPR